MAFKVGDKVVLIRQPDYGIGIIAITRPAATDFLFPSIGVTFPNYPLALNAPNTVLWYFSKSLRHAYNGVEAMINVL